VLFVSVPGEAIARGDLPLPYPLPKNKKSFPTQSFPVDEPQEVATPVVSEKFLVAKTGLYFVVLNVVLYQPDTVRFVAKVDDGKLMYWFEPFKAAPPFILPVAAVAPLFVPFKLFFESATLNVDGEPKCHTAL
jgi:hypothetical protein